MQKKICDGLMHCYAVDFQCNSFGLIFMMDLFFSGNGKISLEEFITVMLNKMKLLDTEEEIKKVFKVFDKVTFIFCILPKSRSL